MTLPLTVLQLIEAFAGWSSTGNLVASAQGSGEIKELRRIRSWTKAGCHGLAIPWTSMKLIADFSGLQGAANLVQTEQGYEMLKLLRAVTALKITSNYWRGLDADWGRPTEVYRFPDSDDEDSALWRRWVGDD